jgi:hypothetical protein
MSSGHALSIFALIYVRDSLNGRVSVSAVLFRLGKFIIYMATDGDKYPSTGTKRILHWRGHYIYR